MVEPHYLVGEESVFVPSAEEKDLLKEYNEARRYGERGKMLKKRDALIHLYVYYSEHFNLSHPNLVSEEDYLKTALALDENHSLANYRMAHVHYKNCKYVEALNSFKKALTGSKTEGLNETQAMLAQIFIMNCGVLIAQEARKEVHSIKINDSVRDERELMNRYQSESLVLGEEIINHMFYCRITADQTDIISGETYSSIIETQELSCVLLLISDHGYEVRFRGQTAPLDTPSFYILYTLLKANRFIKGEEIRRELFDRHLAQAISDSALIKTFAKLKEHLPFWDQLIETTSTGSQTARRLKRNFSYCILFRAGDLLPECNL